MVESVAAQSKDTKKPAADNASIKSSGSKKSPETNSVKSQMGTSKSFSSQPSEKNFKTASFKKLPSIVLNEKIAELDLEDVIYYRENEEKYKVKKGERLIPYIIRMNERFKGEAETRKRTRTVKKGAKVFFFIILTVFVVIILFYAVNYGMGLFGNKK